MERVCRPASVPCTRSPARWTPPSRSTARSSRPLSAHPILCIRPNPVYEDKVLAMKILRISHSAVVDAWRERERELRRKGMLLRLVSARSWDEAGRQVPLQARTGEDVVGIRTFGSHPALFVYDPVRLWRELGREVDVLDVHEEPYALATAEVLG